MAKKKMSEADQAFHDELASEWEEYKESCGIDDEDGTEWEFVKDYFGIEGDDEV